MSLAACDSVEERVARHYDRGIALLAEGDPVKATLEFRNALKLDGDHAASRLEIARLYEADGEFRAAVSNYTLVTELDPANLTAHLRLAQFTLLSGDLERAERHSLRGMELAPDDPEAMAVRAAVLMRAEKTGEAVELAERALTLAPGNPGAALVLASENYTAGDTAGAIAHIDAALAHNSDDLALNTLKLRILEAQGDDVALLTHMRRMIDIYPDDSRFRALLAQWHTSRGEYDLAEGELRSLAETGEQAAVLDLVRLIVLRDGAEAARRELAERISGAAPETALTYEMAIIDLDLREGDLDGAISRLQALASSDAATAQAERARVRLAELELRRGDRDAARRLIADILGRDNKNVEALTLRAAMRLDDEEVRAAIDDLRAAADLDPRNHRIMLLQAQAHERNGSPELAGDRYAAAARASNFDPDVALTYARFLDGRSQPEAALTVVDEALSRNPENTRLLGALAERRLRDGDFGGARALIARLEQAAPDNAGVRRLQAAALSAEGRIAESVEVLKTIEETDAGGGAVLAQLVTTYLRAGRLDDATAVLEARLADTPGDLTATLLTAELALRRGDIAGAEAQLASLRDANPSSPVSYAALTRLRIAQGRFDEAITTAKAGLEAAPDTGSLLLLLAQAQEQSSDFDSAISSYERLYEMDRNAIVVANNLASLISEHRADDPAALTRAATIAQRLRGSTVPQFQDTYGWILYLQGDYEGALRSLVPAAEALPDNAWVQYHVGMAFARLDKDVEARRHLEAALSLAGDGFTRAAEIRASLDALPPSAP